MSNNFLKDPAAVLDYTFDWAEWLAEGETISSFTVTPGAGITLNSSSENDTAVTAWLSGGTAGTVYPVACSITTSAGRTDVRRIHVEVDTR